MSRMTDLLKKYIAPKNGKNQMSDKDKKDLIEGLEESMYTLPPEDYKDLLESFKEKNYFDMIDTAEYLVKYKLLRSLTVNVINNTINKWPNIAEQINFHSDLITENFIEKLFHKKEGVKVNFETLYDVQNLNAVFEQKLNIIEGAKETMEKMVRKANSSSVYDLRRDSVGAVSAAIDVFLPINLVREACVSLNRKYFGAEAPEATTCENRSTSADFKYRTFMVEAAKLVADSYEKIKTEWFV